MWEIDLFAHLKERVTPKLIMFRIVQAWKLNDCKIGESVVGFTNSQCLESVQKSLLKAFDFEFKSDENASCCEKVRPAAELPIQSKAYVVPKLCKQCDAFCMVVRKDENCNYGIRKDSKKEAQRVISEIVQNVQRFVLIRCYESMSILLTELIRRVYSKLDILKWKNSEILPKITNFSIAIANLKRLFTTAARKLKEALS